MKRTAFVFLVVSIILTIPSRLLAQAVAPPIQWDKCFGGFHADYFSRVKQTPDGGFILGGYTISGISGDKSQPSNGISDFWIIKVDINGNKVWDRSYGGPDGETLHALELTDDGGFILGGYSESHIGGDKTQAGKGKEDYWVIKVDSLGNKQWDKTFGENGSDILRSIAQTPDGGYMLGGSSESDIGTDKSQPTRGAADFWIIRLDKRGNKLWDKAYGGSGSDNFHKLIKTADGGYLLGGASWSPVSGEKSQPARGFTDFWVVKIDSTGAKIWDRTFGGAGMEGIVSLQQLSNGHYILGGNSNSGAGADKTQPNQGDLDFWVIKLDGAGNKIWDKTFGGPAVDALISLQETADGGFILGGNSTSNVGGDKTQPGYGDSDYWVLKIDSNGNRLWDKTIGGSWNDYLAGLQQTTDGGFILGGTSNSPISGVKSQYFRPGDDFWIVKLAADVLGRHESIATIANVYPNPSSGKINFELDLTRPVQVTVYNSLGQMILKKTVAKQNAQGHFQLDLMKEPKGLYAIQVISEGVILTRKVVLQ